MTEQEAEEMVKALLKRVNEKDQLLHDLQCENVRLAKENQDKDAEIGQLRQSAVLAQQHAEDLREICYAKDKLLTELCDVLMMENELEYFSTKSQELIQRAREATR